MQRLFTATIGAELWEKVVWACGIKTQKVEAGLHAGLLQLLRRRPLYLLVSKSLIAESNTV
jgi:hypothetical protein